MKEENNEEVDVIGVLTAIISIGLLAWGVYALFF